MITSRSLSAIPVTYPSDIDTVVVQHRYTHILHCLFYKDHRSFRLAAQSALKSTICTTLGTMYDMCEWLNMTNVVNFFEESSIPKGTIWKQVQLLPQVFVTFAHSHTGRSIVSSKTEVRKQFTHWWHSIQGYWGVSVLQQEYLGKQDDSNQWLSK